MTKPAANRRTFTDQERAEIFERYTANPHSGKQLATEYGVTPNVIRGLIFRERQRRAALSAGGHAPAGSDPEAVGPAEPIAFQRLPPLECLQDLLAIFTAKSRRAKKAHMATRDTGAFIREVVAGIIALEERQVKSIDVTPQITATALGRLSDAELETYYNLRRKMTGGAEIELAYDPARPVIYDAEKRDDAETPPPSSPEPG